MWGWYSGDELQSSGGTSPANQSAGTMSVADLSEQLAQTQQLVAQLKDLIREKDNELRKKDQDLKEEKDAAESKISKAKLQNKAKIASLTSQLEDLKKQLTSSGAQVKKPESKKGSGDGDLENASANRGKILVLRKRVEELESQLTLKNEELKKKEVELESHRLRGSELDVMLAAKEEKLAKKEAYIKDLQLSAASNAPAEATSAELVAKVTANDSAQDLQVLIQNLTRKVEESEERYSLLHEQTESLKAFLSKEKSVFQEKEAMYTENIRVYQNIILDKDKEMKLLSEKHEQELFKIAAKSDSTAELHQLLKALKQKLHEDEEVLSGKNQVIDVLQKELDSKDQQITEMTEKCRLLQSEKQNLQSKLDAEKHVMRAQLKDMMEQHATEIQAVHLRHSMALQEINEKHEGEIQEKFQTIQQLQNQLQGLASPGDVRDGSVTTTDSAVSKLQDEVKLKTEESETKHRELSALSVRISELEEEKEALEMKLESVADLQSINEQLLTKLVVYEEQQRILQADLEQVAKRADSQTSESGSVDEMQNPLLEWSHEANISPDQDREDTSVMVLRMAQIEEEREAMDSGQVELEEELSAARGLGKVRTARRKNSRGAAKMQDEFSYSDKSFEAQNLTTETGEIEEGENMGGLGLRAVVEELEMERNQLQEQIMTLEERCQELEDRLQLQHRIESLQSENERLQTQLTQIRQQQSQEAEKHHDLVSTMNDQLKGLTNRNAFLENAIMEKEQTILEATEKLNKMNRISKSLQDKEALNKELLERLDQYEHQFEEVTRRQQASESENSVLKMTNTDLTEKLSVFKDRVLAQDSSLEKLQVELDQTNDELDRLNTSHLEKQSQLLHDLQRCEREVDVLKELLQEKDKEMSSLSASLAEYSEQVTILKETIDFKDEQMSEMSSALVKMERELHHLREAQSLDVQESSTKISSLSEQLGEMESELNKAKLLNESKMKEAEELMRQINEDDITIKNLRLEIQSQAVTHNNHLAECTAQIVSLKEQINASVAEVDETEMNYRKEIESLKLQLEANHSEKERLAVLLEEKSTQEESFHNELKTAKEQYNKLVSKLSKKEEEIKELSDQLFEHKNQSMQLDKELSSKQEELLSLQLNLEALAQRKEDLVKILQEKTEEFQKQMDEKSEIINKLHSETEALLVQTKDLGTSLADKETSLNSVMNSLEELERKVHGLEDQNRQVSNEKEKLLIQVEQKESEISAMTQTLKDIQKKLSEKELELTELQNTTSSLLREKEDLHKEIELISARSVQHNNTTSAQLEEKTKECLNLENRLREEQETALKLRARIRSLKQDLKESRIIEQEKDEALKVKTSSYDVACEQLKQNEEKTVKLQGQVDELSQMVESKKQVLDERETLLTSQSAQIEEMRRNLDKLQNEEQVLREVNLKLTQNVEKLSTALGKLQQDFDDKVEENTKMRTKVEIGSKEIERLTHEKESCLLSMSNLETQLNTLQSRVVQSQSAVDSLNQQLNMIMIEKEKLNSEIELLKTALSNKSEEVNVLSSHSSQQGHTILSLKDQIDLLHVEKRDLLRRVDERDALLLQKEELLQQTEKKLEGEGHYLQTISTLQNELQSSVLACTQQRQRIEDREQELQKLAQQMQLLKNKNEEAGLLKTQLAEHVEIISDLHSQLKDLQDNVQGLTRAVSKKDESLKEKVDSYANLKAQFSELEDSLDEQRKTVETLRLDIAQYKAAIAEKDSTIKNYSLEFQALRDKFQSKEEQCNMLMKQVTTLEETNTRQLAEFNKLTTSFGEQESSHCRKHEALIAELEQNRNLTSDLHKTLDELSNKVKALEQSVSEKENTVQNLQEKYASLYEQKQELTESNSHKDAEISKLLNSASEKDAKLQMLESNVQAFASEVNLLREELDKGTSNVKNVSEALKLKDDIISQYQNAEEALRLELQTIKVEFLETNAQLQALTGEREENGALIQSLQGRCTSQSQYIESLRQDVDNLNSRLLQDQHTFALDKQQICQQLESAVQNKLQLENLVQTLQVGRDSSLATLQNELIDKNALIENFEQQVQKAEARISSDEESLNLLKAENIDLQKQVSAEAEKSYALKVLIENLKLNLSELQQQSEKKVTQVNEENGKLREQNESLASNIKVKEEALQSLSKDLHFVDKELCALCDEKFSACDAFDQQFSYRSKLEKFSSMLCIALDYKSKVIELKEVLEGKDREIEEKTQTVLSFEKETELLLSELQKVKEQKMEDESLMEELKIAKVTSSHVQSILEEKENVIIEVNSRISVLQEELTSSKEDLQRTQTLLNEERTKIIDLMENFNKNDSVIQELNIQLSQQKELISTLGDQLKEKDASLMQVMESMSGEMVKFSEAKNIFSVELKNLQSDKSTCLLQISELCEKLESCEKKLQLSEQTLADKETYLSKLANEKDLQSEKFSKERENLKRKLQAALVIRKDLLHKIEKLEQVKQDELREEQLKKSELGKTVEELNDKLESIRKENEDLQSDVQLAKQELVQKDAKIGELCSALSEKEEHLAQLQSNVDQLQQSFSEKDNMCQEYLRTIQEKEQNLHQTKSALKGKLKSLEEENIHLLENLENLKTCLEKIPGQMGSTMPPLQTSNVDLESTSAEASFSHAEKSIVHNNVHASLLCNQGNSENKGKHGVLLQSLSKSIKDFELLQKAHLDLQHSYDAKVSDCEQQKEQVNTLQQQVQAQQQLLFQKESELNNKDLEVEEHKKRIENISHELQGLKGHEKVTSELTTSIHEKNAELQRLNSEHLQLVNEMQLSKAEIQKLTRDIQQYQEQIHSLNGVVASKSVELERSESEITLLQKEVDAGQMIESNHLIIQQLINERDSYLETCRVSQSEISELKRSLELNVLELLEKDKEIAASKDSLHLNLKIYEEDMERMHSQLKDYQKESDKLKSDYKQIKGELEESMLKLEKAYHELSDFRTTSRDSKKDEILMIKSNMQPLESPGLHQVVTEAKAILETQEEGYDSPTMCKTCSKKQTEIEDLQKQILSNSKLIEQLNEDHERKVSEESSSKEQLQRKLQAALLSRKDLLKENKMLKQKIESLTLEMEELKSSLSEVRENRLSEISLLSEKNNDLLSEKERLLLVNENLSAACESLKSTMESIVQEKEAFSFQLNSLKDSQTVELTGWKAKHGELNKEYESLLQAYENISDEIDKMRHVIEITKKEKNDVLMKYHELQTENQGLAKEFDEGDAEMDRLRATMDSKEREIQKLKLENERLLDAAEKTVLFEEISQENWKLTDENKHLRETCENLKTSLDSKEKENNSISVIKTTLDKLQMDMSMYKSDMEVKMSELSTENETLSRTVTELEAKVQETEQFLENNDIERLNVLDKLKNSDQLLKLENNTVLKLQEDRSNMEIEIMNLSEKVKILEDDKALLLEEIENIQEQFCKVKNERENLEMELLRVVKNNSLLSDKFKSLQAQTNTLSQQVEFLRAEKNTIVREKEEHQLKVLRDLEERIKCAQDDSRGTKTKSKELQELLKEKQQEINQLHRDSIRFQELILDLEGDLKESNSQNENLKKELDLTSALLTQARNDIFILDKELADLTGKKQLDKDHFLSYKKIVNAESNNTFSQRINETNGIESYKLKENEPSYQPKEVVLQNMGSEKRPLNEVIEHPTDVELKALKDIIQENEREIQKLRLDSERVRIDIQKQVTISQHMKEIIDNKDKEISLLISSKDGEISGYLEQIQSQYRKQVGDYERRLASIDAEKAKSDLEHERVEKEYETLKETHEKTVNEKALISSEIKAFRKSMSSLQTDRDQLSSELQILSQRNEQVLSKKDSIILSAVNENSSLKEELRNALNKIDDLNAENAMLGAQLIRYREDLNQVLSLKDEQLKELLKQKLELIKNLEQQKCDLEKQCRAMQSTNETLQNSVESLGMENQKFILKVKDQEELIAALNKEKIIFESRKKKYRDDLANSDEDLISFEHIDDQLGIENDKPEENADEAYWGLFLENKQLKSQNESFGKAMAALQNNRDSLIDDFKELQWRYASELKTEKIRGDDLESQLRRFKSQIYSILKNTTLLGEHLLTIGDQITVDQLVAAMDSLCNSLTNKDLEVTSLSSECVTYAQQIDAFSKAMASLQHDRERLLHMLKEGTIVAKSKLDDASIKEVIAEHELNMNFSQPDKLTQITELINNSASESLKLRTRIQELERLLLEAKSTQQKLEKAITGYQHELSELRSEKNVLATESQALRHHLNTLLAERDRQIGEVQTTPETTKQSDRLHGEKGVERVTLVASSVATEKGNLTVEDREQTKNEIQRYLHEIRQRDLIIQQLNTKAMESVEMNAVLSAQLKSVSQGLKDTQMRYTDLQSQYYKLQRDLQVTRVTSQNDLLTEVPPGAPQERANVLVEIDTAELSDLRRRLTEAELRHDATQRELSVLSDRLAEEKAQREAAEEALHLTEQHQKRLETKSSSRDYEFSLQMESDDEREALIIDPSQNIALRTIKSCNMAVRRWLHGRSLYCSKLLVSRSKSRYLFLTYLLGLHVLILMCLTGAL